MICFHLIEKNLKREGKNREGFVLKDGKIAYVLTKYEEAKNRHTDCFLYCFRSHTKPFPKSDVINDSGYCKYNNYCTNYGFCIS